MQVCPKCGAENEAKVKNCQECGFPFTSDKPKDVLTPSSFKDVRKRLAEVLEGKYELVGEIGRGGMAIVYKAIDLGLERIDAIKVLPVELAYDQEFVERFHREAKTAARLNHPNIITIYSVRREGNLNFMIMKFIEGQSVKELLKKQKTIPVEQSLKILKDVCQALFFAHKEGVIHRDIKPDNIMVDRHGNSIVMDFGIAKAVSSSQLTQAGSFLGTASYMAPEQIRGKADNRADLYSLGIVAYKMLTGRVPFRGNDSYEIHYKHLHDEPSPPTKFNPMVPLKLEQFILKLLRKEPDERYQSAREAFEDLNRLEMSLRSTSEDIQSISIQSQNITEEIGLYHTEAMKAFEDKDYERAISLWEKLLSLDPSYVRAIEYIKKAKQKIEDQSKISLYMQEAEEHFEKEEFSEAIRCYGQVIALDADNQKAFNRIAEARSFQAKRDVVFQQLLEASELFKQQEFDKALAKYTEVLKADPSNQKAKDRIDEIQSELGKMDEVNKLLAQGEQAYKAHDFQRAKECWEKVFKLFPGHLKAAQCLEKLNTIEEKLANLDEALEDAKLLHKQERFEEAISSWEEILFLKPDNSVAQKGLEEARKKLEEQRFVQKTLRETREHIDAHDYEQAKLSIDAVLAKDKDNQEAHELLSQIEKELEKARKILQLKNEGIEAYENREYEKAIELLCQAAELDPKDVEIQDTLKESRHIFNRQKIKELLSLGKQYMQEKQYLEAVACFEGVMDIDAKYPGINELQQEAAEALERQEMIEMLLQKGESLTKDGRLAEAIIDWQEVLELDPENEKAKKLLDKHAETVEEVPSEVAAQKGEDNELIENLINLQFWNHVSEDSGNGDEPQDEQTALVYRQFKEQHRKHAIACYPIDTHYFTTVEISSYNHPLPLYEDVSDFSEEMLFEEMERQDEPFLYQYPTLDKEEIESENALEDMEFTQVSQDSSEATQLFMGDMELPPEERLSFSERMTKGLRENFLVIVLGVIVILAVGFGLTVAINIHKKQQQEIYMEKLRTKTIDKIAGGHYQAALLYIDEFLKINPDDEYMQTKKTLCEREIAEQKAQKELEEKRKRLFLDGQRAKEEGNWQKCIETANEILKIAPESLVAQNWKSECLEKRDQEEYEKNRQQFIENALAQISEQVALLQKAQSLDEAKPYVDEANSIIERLLSKEKEEDIKQITQFRTQIQGKLNELETKKSLADAITNMNAADQSGNSSKAIFWAKKVLDMDPGNGKAKSIKSTHQAKLSAAANAAQFEREKKALLNSGKNAFNSKEYTKCINTMQQVLEEYDENNAEALEFINKAKKAIQAEKAAAELEKQLAALQAQAEKAWDQAMKTKNFKQVYSLCNQILALDSTSNFASEMLDRAKQADKDTDRIPPEFKGKPDYDKKAKAGKDVTVKVNVEDTGGANPGVDNVTMYYKKVKDSKWRSEIMLLRRGKYTGRISDELTQENTKIEFYIEACDPAGNCTREPAGKKTYELEVEAISYVPGL